MISSPIDHPSSDEGQVRIIIIIIYGLYGQRDWGWRVLLIGKLQIEVTRAAQRCGSSCGLERHVKYDGIC